VHTWPALCGAHASALTAAVCRASCATGTVG
jgi:hypothetical protein